jgi:hypothetical protein
LVESGSAPAENRFARDAAALFGLIERDEIARQIDGREHERTPVVRTEHTQDVVNRRDGHIGFAARMLEFGQVYPEKPRQAGVAEHDVFAAEFFVRDARGGDVAAGETEIAAMFEQARAHDARGDGDASRLIERGARFVVFFVRHRNGGR